MIQTLFTEDRSEDGPLCELTKPMQGCLQWDQVPACKGGDGRGDNFALGQMNAIVRVGEPLPLNCLLPD